MKIFISCVSLILIISMCLGGFNYEFTKNYISSKFIDIKTYINNISGLLGIEETHRVDSNSAEYMDKVYYFNFENMTLKSIIEFEMHKFDKANIAVNDVDYKANITFDACNKYVYDLVVTSNSVIDGVNVNIVRTIPCLRLSSGANEYLFIDPHITNSFRFGIQIAYGTNVFGERVWQNVGSNVVLVEGETLTPIPLDLKWYQKYQSALSLWDKIKEFFRTDEPYVFNARPLNAYMKNSLHTVDDLFNGTYVYKPDITIPV